MKTITYKDMTNFSFTKTTVTVTIIITKGAYSEAIMYLQINIKEKIKIEE